MVVCFTARRVCAVRIISARTATRRERRDYEENVETSSERRRKRDPQDLLREYRFDYRKARPNRSAAWMRRHTLIVVVDPDLARVFPTSASVNHALRRLIGQALPILTRRASTFSR
jgi:hypothetical protein